MQKQKLISKDFILLFVFSVLVCTGMNMLNVIVPLYVTNTLGQSTGVAGLMTTVYTVAACVSRPVNGSLADKAGRKNIMVAGMVLFGLGCFGSGLLPGLLMLTVGRVFMGVGYSAASTANNTASTDVIPAERMAEGIGYFGMSQSVASAFGSALAAVVIAAIGDRLALVFNGFVAVAAIVLALFIRYEAAEDYKKPISTKRKSAGFEKTAAVPAVFQGVSLFLISCLMCFMTLYITYRGFPSSLAGSFFTVASVMIILVRLLCSGGMNRFSPQTFLLPAYGMLAACCLLLPAINSTAGFILCAVLYGIAHGVIWMVLGSEAVRYAPADQRGAANATFYFAFDAAIGIGAAVWGGLIDVLGYTVCFRIVAIAAAIVAAAAVPVFRRRGAKYKG